MRTAASTRLRQAGIVLVASLSVLGASGCQAVNPQDTQMSYDPSDGVAATVGQVQLRNVFVAAAAKGTPARLGGALFNQSDRATTVTLSSGSGTQSTVKLPANASYYLQQEPAVNLGDVDQNPGSLVEMKLTETASGATSTVRVPVVDGTLEEYRTVVPGSPAPTGTPTSTPTETASASATSSPTG
ncbi:hypothetical protein [Tersicoccus sp. Bi-70]|uniref:hypothetical protein n=1 Tax=Tersicoccus sp. Bi-70 TaxID=1897634 RepID=UPI00097688A1|nr:hypothetical protein [Tersicoccus sp. Bi-70]OMH37567.1 hypothetical protein BGP79_12140 [Tersicoccus sp. Bi-70]